jgi:hypothetical protein
VNTTNPTLPPSGLDHSPRSCNMVVMWCHGVRGPEAGFRTGWVTGKCRALLLGRTSLDFCSSKLYNIMIILCPTTWTRVFEISDGLIIARCKDLYWCCPVCLFRRSG